MNKNKLVRVYYNSIEEINKLFEDGWIFVKDIGSGDGVYDVILEKEQLPITIDIVQKVSPIYEKGSFVCICGSHATWETGKPFSFCTHCGVKFEWTGT